MNRRYIFIGCGVLLVLGLIVGIVVVVGVVGVSLLASSSNQQNDKGATTTQQQGVTTTKQTTANQKREVTGQVSLDSLISQSQQVGDFKLQSNDPLQTTSETGFEDGRQLTYESPDSTQVKLAIIKFDASAANSSNFADTFLKGFADSVKNSLDGNPKQTEFQVKDESGKQVGKGVLLQGSNGEAIAWTNGRLGAGLGTPKGAQDFYDNLPY